MHVNRPMRCAASPPPPPPHTHCSSPHLQALAPEWMHAALPFLCSVACAGGRGQQPAAAIIVPSGRAAVPGGTAALGGRGLAVRLGCGAGSGQPGCGHVGRKLWLWQGSRPDTNGCSPLTPCVAGWAAEPQQRLRQQRHRCSVPTPRRQLQLAAAPRPGPGLGCTEAEPRRRRRGGRCDVGAAAAAADRGLPLARRVGRRLAGWVADVARPRSQRHHAVLVGPAPAAPVVGRGGSHGCCCCRGGCGPQAGGAGRTRAAHQPAGRVGGRAAAAARCAAAGAAAAAVAVAAAAATAAEPAAGQPGPALLCAVSRRGRQLHAGRPGGRWRWWRVGSTPPSCACHMCMCQHYRGPPRSLCSVGPSTLLGASCLSTPSPALLLHRHAPPPRPPPRPETQACLCDARACPCCPLCCCRTLHWAA